MSTQARRERKNARSALAACSEYGMVRLCLAGEGAQGFSHYATLSEIPGVEVVTLCGGVADDTEQFAKVRRGPRVHVHVQFTRIRMCTEEAAVLYISVHSQSICRLVATSNTSLLLCHRAGAKDPTLVARSR